MLLLFGTIFSFTIVAIVALSVSIRPHMPPSNVFSSAEFMSGKQSEGVRTERPEWPAVCYESSIATTLH